MPHKEISEAFRRAPITVSVTTVYVVILIPIVFFLSLALLNAYTNGDQVHYHKLYEALAGASLLEIPFLLYSIASSAEPLTGFILWIGANLGVEKNIFISGLNVVLVAGLFVLVRRHKAPWPISFLLLSNFYLLVLLTAAERLKIAYIFLVFSAIFVGKTRLALLFLSPFAHLQSLVLMMSVFSAYLDRTIKDVFLRLRISKRDLLFLLGSTTMGLIVFSLLSDGLLIKTTNYMERETANTGIINIVLLLFVSLLVTCNRLRMVLTFLPLFVAMLLLGRPEISMIATTVVFFLLLIEQRLHHLLVYGLMIYFSLKSIPYVYNIFTYGDGFLYPPHFIDLPWDSAQTPLLIDERR